MGSDDKKAKAQSELADEGISELRRDLAPRTQLGDYIVHEEIGAGGMSEVFRASHFETGRVVALKILRPEHAEDDEIVTMFTDEARAQVLVNHRNVVQLFEIGRKEGATYSVMQYVHGVTLGELLVSLDDGDRMPDDVAAWIVSEAAAGAHAIHEMQSPTRAMGRLVHRDLNPNNLLLGDDGSVRIFDFGLVFGDGRKHQTDAGVVKVRLRYAAPEQLQSPAERGPLDRRVDVYQLGLTLYELVAGPAFPLSLSDVDVVEKAQEGLIDDVAERRPDLDPRLAEVIRAAIAVDRERRTGTAEALREALVPFIRGDSRAQLVFWLEERCAALLGSRRSRAASFVQ